MSDATGDKSNVTSVMNENTKISEKSEKGGKTKWKWQAQAKLIGYINMLVGSSCLTYVIAGAVWWTYIKIQKIRGVLELNAAEEFTDLEPKSEHALYGIGFSMLRLGAIVFSLDIYAGNTLVKATSKESDVHKCLEMCKTWRNVNIIIVMLSCTIIPIGYHKLYVWLWMFNRAENFLVVLPHIHEVQIKSDEVNLKEQKYTNT